MADPRESGVSLIDDVRLVAESASPRGDGCRYCDSLVPYGTAEHADGCPWGLMPRIVAVLEAADALADKYGTVYLEDLGTEIEAVARALRGRAPWDDDDDDEEPA